MKLTLWQQFSSNHSNSFWVVGEFSTEAEAGDAAKRFNAILNEMLANAEKDDANNLITQQLNQLGINWNHESLPDWLVSEMLLTQQYKNLVFVDNGGDNSYAIPEPLNAILAKLGSKTTTTISEYGTISSVWACEFDVLDASRADELETFVHNILTMDMDSYHIQEDSDIKNSTLDNEMWWLSWREGMEGIPIDFERNQSHFKITNAHFWFIIPHAKVLELFTGWLESRGATNIQYTVKAKT